MRKVYVYMMLSIDGYFEGRDHDISWHNVDEELNEFNVDLLSDADFFIFGRRTYQLMESFWPQASNDPTMSESERKIAHLLNHTPKIVYSKTLDGVQEQANWKNVELKNTFDPEEIRRLKAMPGKSMWVGGSDLAVTFLKSGLIDECIFTVSPVVIGAGTPIFKGIDRRHKFELLGSRTFKSGNVQHRYRPIYAPTTS